VPAGRPASELWGCRWLYSRRERWVKICASLSAKKSSVFNSPSLSSPFTMDKRKVKSGLSFFASADAPVSLPSSPVNDEQVRGPTVGLTKCGGAETHLT